MYVFLLHVDHDLIVLFSAVIHAAAHCPNKPQPECDEGMDNNLLLIDHSRKQSAILPEHVREVMRRSQLSQYKLKHVRTAE